jgi:hypothetical protein
MGLQALQPRVALAESAHGGVAAQGRGAVLLVAAWIALRDRVRREAGGRCQVQAAVAFERRMIVDHIVELKDGGAPLERSERLVDVRVASQQRPCRRAREAHGAEAGGPLILGAFWGALPDGGSRREFFPPANTSKNGPFRGLT